MDSSSTSRFKRVRDALTGLTLKCLDMLVYEAQSMMVAMAR